MTLTPDQLHILQHSLGCDQYGRTSYRGDADGDHCFGLFHRNRYVSDPTDYLTTLVTMGLMRDAGEVNAWGGMRYYRVTESGLAAMREQSPRPPKLSPAKQRYLDYLNSASGWTFGEWLKNGGYRPYVGRT